MYKRQIRHFLGNNNGSPWTSALGAVKSFCGNPTSVPVANNAANEHPITATSFAVPDSNLVVKDGREYRNWVHVKGTDPINVPADFLYDDDADNQHVDARLPEGFRMLVVPPSIGCVSVNQTPDTTLRFYDNPVTDGDTTVNTKKDPYGNFYHDSIVQLRAGQWIVIRTPDEWNECAVLSEGLVYQYAEKPVVANPRAQRSTTEADVTFGWRSLLPQYMGNDCFHYPTRVENTDGLTYRYKKTCLLYTSPSPRD